jgi:hypothetical protein
MKKYYVGYGGLTSFDEISRMGECFDTLESAKEYAIELCDDMDTVMIYELTADHILTARVPPAPSILWETPTTKKATPKKRK